MLVGCSNPPLKFHFAQEVVVTKGFFRDCTGRIDYYDTKSGLYGVDLTCGPYILSTKEIEESYLKGKNE